MNWGNGLKIAILLAGLSLICFIAVVILTIILSVMR